MSQNVSQCLTSADRLNGTEDDGKTLALALILAGKPDTEVAKEVGVHRRTIYRWRHEDEQFLGELNRRRRELWNGLGDRLRSLLDPAVDVLARQLSDPYERTRFRAATTLLKLADVRKAMELPE
jgi:hypothetical protein